MGTPQSKNELQTLARERLQSYGIPLQTRDAVLTPTNLALMSEALQASGEGRDASSMTLQDAAGLALKRHHSDFFGEIRPEASKLGPVEGFIKSALSSGGQEMIGLDAMDGVEEWRAERPWAGLASEIIGMAPTFAVGMAAGPRLAVQLPVLGRRYAGMLKSAQAIEGAFARGAVSEVVRLAPLEVGLIGAGAGASAVTGDTKALERTMSRAMTDMALIGVTGGVLTKIPTTRPFSRLQIQGEERIQKYLDPDYVIGATPHDKLKKLVALENSPKWQGLEEADQITVREVSAQLKKQIREQVPVARVQAPVEPLVVGESKKVSELFRVGKQKQGFTGFLPVAKEMEPKLWAEFATRLDLDALPNWEANTQFFRYIRADSDKGSAAVRRTINDNLVPVGKNLWMGKEADGAYVMATRLKGRAGPPRKAPKAAPKAPLKPEGEAVPRTFQTALGSEYTIHPDGTTTRNKAPRPDHPDSGPQPRSLATYFVDEAALGKLAEVTARGGPGSKTIERAGEGLIGVRYRTGRDSGKFEQRTIVPTVEPKVGAFPVEVFQGSVHFGNRITSIGEAAKTARAAEARFPRRPSRPSPMAYAKEGDLFAVWKTDAPALFNPEASKFGGALAEHSFKFLEKPLLQGALRSVPLAKEVDELVSKVFPAGVARGGPRDTSKVLRAMVGEAGARDLSAAGEAVKEGAKTYLAPSISRYTASPTATRLSNIARATFAKATAHAHDLFYGKPTVKRTGSLTAEVFRARPETTGGILPFVERMEAVAGEEGAVQFSRAHALGMSPSEAKAAGFNYTVVELLRKLQKVDKPLFAQTQAVYDAAGRKISPLENHLLMVRSWRGDVRLDLHVLKADGTRGAKVGIASGRTTGEAVHEAKVLQQALGAEGKKVVFDPRGTYHSTRELDTALATTVNWASPEGKALRFAQANRIATAGTPGRMKPRLGARGFAGDIRPLSYKEIKEAILGSVKGMMNTQAEVLLRDLYLGDELLRLRASHGSLFGKAEFPQLAEALDRMINLFMGRQTPLSQTINRATDRILAPVLGANSASKIGYAMNKTMGTLTLGALDLGFPTMNAITWVQTVLPEAAFLLRSPSRSLEPYYQPMLIRGRQTGFGIGWQLEPLRVAIRGFKQMQKPDEGLRLAYRQAIREGVINPKFAEEFLGEATTTARRAFDTGDFVGFLDQVNRWLPGKSEEFARLHAFTTGHIIGRDFLKLEGERLFQAARTFTERTMYNYGVMDRAAMITGPLGSPFGLFKNWTMHYLWNMGAYAKQGFQNNNWAPFLWGMAGTWSVAGALGVPGYFVADGMSRLLSDKPLIQNLYAQWGDMADVAAYGLPAFLDVATAGRADAPGSDMVRDVNGLLGVATLKRIKDTGEFVGDSVDRWRLTGQWPFESQASFDKFLLAFAPRTVQRGMQAIGRDTIRSMRTQNAIVDGLSATDQLVFTFTGFQDVDMAKAFEADSIMWKNNEARKKLVQTFGDEIGAAMQANDLAALNVLWTQALQRGAPLDAIAKSAAANLRARRETAETRRGNLPANIEIRQEMLGRDLTLEQR